MVGLKLGLVQVFVLQKTANAIQTEQEDRGNEQEQNTDGHSPNEIACD